MTLHAVSVCRCRKSCDGAWAQAPSNPYLYSGHPQQRPSCLHVHGGSVTARGYGADARAFGSLRHCRAISTNDAHRVRLRDWTVTRLSAICHGRTQLRGTIVSTGSIQPTRIRSPIVKMVRLKPHSDSGTSTSEDDESSLQCPLKAKAKDNPRSRQ